MKQDNDRIGFPSLRTLTANFRQRILDSGEDRQNGSAAWYREPEVDWAQRGISQSISQGVVEFLAQAENRPGIRGTAYDTAWLASIHEKTEGETKLPQYPTALQWLLDNQWTDGSWGGAVRYEHDRILSTLAALAALRAYDNDEFSSAIEDGTRYLWRRGHLIATEPTELVAFELLLPTLVKRAQDVGIRVPPHLDVYQTERAEKMRLIPAGALYSPRVTLVHSLEFLGEQADLAGLFAAQGANGAIGNSPAATAFFYQLSGDRRALAYLDQCLAHSGDNAVSVLHPCETYELLWTAYHLYLAGVPLSRLMNHRDAELLREALRAGGVSLSPTFPIPDADDTAVALIFLHELGDKCDPRLLRAFELSEGHFASFPYERHSSIGVNLHVLHALLRVPGYRNVDQTLEKLLDYIASQQKGGLYWLDKWHISPYYATAHALCVMSQLPPDKVGWIRPLLRRSREWLCQTQNANGSWGFYGQPTMEETAFALLALTAGAIEPLTDWESRACSAAAQYLHEQIRQFKQSGDVLLPPLWIDKCLYLPTLVVWATVESALLAHRSLAKRSYD